MADPAAGSQAHAYTAPQTPTSATTRGQFLTLSSVGLGAMIGAVIGVPATAYLLAPVTQETTFQPVYLGWCRRSPAREAFDPTAATYIEDPKNPATSAGLAWVHYTGKNGTNWLDTQNAMFVVFSNRCMHLGCPVARRADGLCVPLPRGQSTTEGIRIGGPPIRPLDRFQWEIKKGAQGDELWITQRWSVYFLNGKLTYYPVKMPGQPVHVPGGEWVNSWVPDVLYPNVTYTHGPVPKAF